MAAQSHKRLTITGISDALRKLRNLRDKRDIASAKAEYNSETFAELFNYKKVQGQHATLESLQQLLRVGFHRDQIAVTESRIFSLVDSPCS